MTPAPEPNEFLDDVIADSQPADFRATLLGETLRLAGRRRRGRRLRRAAGVATVAAAVMWAIGLTVGRSGPRREGGVAGMGEVATVATVASCEVVRTVPMPATAVVETRRFAGENAGGGAAPVTFVRTEATAGGVREIDDGALLALAGPRPAALVRVGPRAQELIFLDDPGSDDAR